MADAVTNLQSWFNSLSDTDKKSVLTFLYGGKVLIQKGLYTGPSPTLVERGLFTGPSPSSSSNVCGACGRPL